MKRAPDGYPTWKRPDPPGYGEAMHSAGTVVAPLLAGFSIAMIVLVLDIGRSTSDQDAALAYPDLALALLVAAAGSLIAAVQCAFWARQYQALPGDIEQWWGGLDDISNEKLYSNWKRARREQFGYEELQTRWQGRFHGFYHAGVLNVLLALLVVLIPPGGLGLSRIPAIVIAGLAILGELTWILAAHFASEEPPKRRASIRYAVSKLVPKYEAVDPQDIVDGVEPVGAPAAAAAPAAVTKDAAAEPPTSHAVQERPRDRKKRAKQKRPDVGSTTRD